MRNGERFCPGGSNKSRCRGWRRLLASLPAVATLMLLLCGITVTESAAKNFTPMTDMASTRYGHTVTLLPNGKVLITGGFDNSRCLNSAELYDPATGTISPTKEMNVPRMGHSATLLATGKVLISGGRNGSTAVNSAEVYDPASGKFRAASGSTLGRTGHSATLLASGKVLIVGGINDNRYLGAGELYDPATGTVVAVPGLVAERHGHTATLLHSGKVLIVGGMKDNSYVSSVEIYDPVAGTFSVLTNAAASRYAHSATLLADGKVLIVGGRNAGGMISSAEMFDPVSATLTAVAEMTSPRDDHTATLMPDGTVLIAGGRGLRGYLDAAEVFDPELGNFMPTANMTSVRDISSAILLPNNKVLVVGGWNGTSATGSAETFDPELLNTIYRLQLNTVGVGEGAVVFSPGKSCSGNCKQFYISGTTVRLSPAADEDIRSLGWTGCDSVDGADCIVTMTANRHVKLKAVLTETNEGSPSFAITASAGPNGAIAPAGQTMVQRGDQLAYTITPSAGYHVAEVLVDGHRDLGPVTSFTFTRVQKPHTIAAFFAPNEPVTIMAAAEANGTISPSGEVLIPSGSGQDFSITPAAGFQVADLLVDGVSVGAQTSYSFTGVTADHTIAASFTPIVYTINATAGSNGSISPAGAASINSGAGIDYSITPAAGYLVADVLVDAVSIGAVSSYSFTNVTANHSIAASFIPVVYEISAAAGGNGSIAPAGVSRINSGSGQDYSITPAAGFKVADVLVDGVSVGAVTSYSFSNVTASHSIAVSFSPIVYRISATAGANGAIDPAGENSVNHGATLDFTTTPADGFKVADLLVDGVSVGAVTSYSFSNVTANHSIAASFSPIVYQISATAGANGTIDPAGGNSVNHGAVLDFAITPAAGFKVADVHVDGVSVGALTSYSFSNVTANHNIAASFSPIVYQINATAGANGVISPAGGNSVNHGAALDFTITPSAGFQVAQVAVDDVSVGAVTSYSFGNVTANHSISATFTPIVYTINASAAANGVIDPVGASNLNHGSGLSYSIIPAAGFKVADVEVDGVSVGAVTSYSFSSVTADHSIAASFSPIVYSISATSGADGAITPSGVSSVNHGSGLSYSITPAAGFKVADLMVDGVSVGAVTSYSFSSVTADHSIMATFSPIVYTVTATAGANGSIDPAGPASVNHGADLSYTVTPAQGFRIAEVLVDGVSIGAVATYSFTSVAANHVISASFTPIVFEITATAGVNGSITPSGTSSVNHGSGLGYSITPAPGFRVADVQVDGVSVGPVTSYSFSGVVVNHSISVSFSRILYTVSASAGANGSILPVGESSVDYGAALSYFITPASGFQVLDVLVDGVSVGSVTSYQLDQVTSNHTISASFTPIVYTITASAGANGSITPAGSSSVNHGASLSYTIAPMPDYQVADVLVDNVSVGAVTSYSFSEVNASHSISVTFSQIIQAHTISASAGVGGSIAPAGVTSINRGDTLTYTITAASGYRIAEVLVDGVSVGAVFDYVFSDVTANHTIAATFVPAYNITAAAMANGSIEPSGVVTVAKYGSQSFTITPAPGYKVLYVMVDSVSRGEISSYSFTNVTAPHSITAYFSAITYPISASAGTNGSITPSGTSNVNLGASKTYTITPAAGHHIADVLVDGVSVGAVASYTFSEVSAAHAISASFEANPAVTISASAGPNGTISPSGEVTVLSGVNKSFSFVAEVGYRVAEILVDGVPKGAGSSYTFNNVSGNHSISVTFTPDVFTLSTNAGPNGSIDPAGVITVARGGSQDFAIVPAPGYQVANVTIDSSPKGPLTSYSFTNVVGNRTIMATFTPIIHVITSSAGSNGAIAPAGPVNVNEGTDKTFTITPAPGYHIVDVLVDQVSVGAVASYGFTDVSAAHSISASFAANPTVTIAAVAGANGTIAPAGDVTMLSGVAQSFTFTPVAGYRVADVVVDGVSAGAMASYTFADVSAYHTISVSFTLDVYTINASAGANGSIDPSGLITLNSGASQTYSITPVTGYNVASVEVDGVSKGALTSYTFTNLKANHSITALFAANLFPITATAGANGSISSAGIANVSYGSDKSYSITPAPGYHVEDVLVDGVSVGALTSYTFSSVTAAHTISATFAANPTVIISASAGPNGTISPAGEVAVLSGLSKSFTFTPAYGYRVADVVVDGVSKGAVTSYNFVNISGTSHTISVTFTFDSFLITASAMANGSIDPAGSIIVARNGTQSFTVTPASGYKVLYVMVDGVSKGPITSYTFSNVTVNHSIVGYFGAITYPISASAGSNGSISPTGTVNVNQGSNKSYTITAAAGYHVEDVLVDGVSVGALTSYTFSNVLAPHTISASFAANPMVTISASAGPNGTISPQGEVTTLAGTNKSFTFTPLSGYRVGDVLVDGVSKGKPNSYTFVNVTGDHTISVSFTPDVYTITASSTANGSIEPAGVTTVARGGGQSYAITPAAGYKVQYVMVNGQSKGAVTSYSFSNVTANQTITAYFTPITYTISASSGNNGTVSPSGVSTVALNGSKTYTITPAPGYHVNEVLVDGLSVGEVGSYTFSNVSESHTISATFAANQAVTISATADQNGIITPSGAQSVLAGVSKTFTMTAAPGYRVADVLVDGVSVGAVSSYTFSNVATDHTIQVTFTLDVFTITATTGANGSIDPSGVATLNRGDSITYTITPAPGYRVLDLLVDGVYRGALTSYSFSNVTANHTISPTFALVE